MDFYETLTKTLITEDDVIENASAVSKMNQMEAEGGVIEEPKVSMTAISPDKEMNVKDQEL